MNTILLVEDSAFQQRLMSKHLSATYRIVTADSGEHALQLLERVQPLCVITDLIMPGMDGLQLIAQLRQASAAPPPIIVSTADIQDTTRLKCLGMGAFAVLNKPVKREELLALLAEIEAGANLP